MGPAWASIWACMGSNLGPAWASTWTHEFPWGGVRTPPQGNSWVQVEAQAGPRLEPMQAQIEAHAGPTKSPKPNLTHMRAQNISTTSPGSKFRDLQVYQNPYMAHIGPRAHMGPYRIHMGPYRVQHGPECGSKYGPQYGPSFGTKHGPKFRSKFGPFWILTNL